MCDHDWEFQYQRKVAVGYLKFDIYLVYKCTKCGEIKEEFGGTLVY